MQYHFVSRDAFTSLLDKGGFVEHAEFSGNLYGTSKQAIASIVESGKRCILDIEVQVCFLLCPSLQTSLYFFFPGRPPNQGYGPEPRLLFHCSTLLVHPTRTPRGPWHRNYRRRGEAP